MNVLIVVPWDQEFGGVASVVRNIAEQLRTRGHAVQFFHPGESSYLVRRTARNGFPAWELNLRSPFVDRRPVISRIAFVLLFFPTLIRLLILLRRERIDVVNVHYPLDNFVWFALCRALLPVRLVVSVHGGDLVLDSNKPRPLRWGVRRLLRAADQIVVPSAGYRDEALGGTPDLLPRVRVIHNAVDLAGLGAPLTRPAADGPPFILTVAAHNHRKGVDVVLSAFGRLAPRYPGLELYLVGDGPLRQELEAQADSGPVRSRVRFMGQRQPAEVMALLRECRVFVLPSRSESFGIAALEALGCGAAVVASRVGGLPEIIEDGRDGILVPSDDPEALSHGICRILDDPALARRFGAAGAERVAAQFGASRAGAAYEALFSELLTEPPDRS